MADVSRLMATGIKPDCAQKIVMWFRAQGNDSGLEEFIKQEEQRYALYLLQSKPQA